MLFTDLIKYLADLKPENILLHTPGPYPRLMIADFGLARPRAYEETLNAVGTICYMPPEAILALQAKSCGYVGIYADAWSLGMVIFVMLWLVQFPVYRLIERLIL